MADQMWLLVGLHLPYPSPHEELRADTAVPVLEVWRELSSGKVELLALAKFRGKIEVENKSEQ